MQVNLFVNGVHIPGEISEIISKTSYSEKNVKTFVNAFHVFLQENC